jgi:hypothetical protein
VYWNLVSGALPPGLTLGWLTGTISGTPIYTGSYDFTIQASDSSFPYPPEALFATRLFTLAIAESGSYQGPDGKVGVPYPTVTLSAQGAGTPPWTWAITLGGLPPGLALNSATGQISGTPTTLGDFHFSAVWTDKNGATGYPTEFIIRILAPALTITTDSLLNTWTVGVPVSQRLTATGGTPPYSNWRLDSDYYVLPPGLALDAATGVISGTPTEAHTSAFGVWVNDSAGASVYKTFVWHVSPAVLTIITVSLDTMLSNIAMLNNGSLGRFYSQTFAVADGIGIAPYTWSISSGSLPSGLTLSAAGVLSGTPTETCFQRAFTVRGTDAAGLSATKAFTVNVGMPDMVLEVTGLYDTVRPGFQPTFDVRRGPYPLAVTGTITLTFKPIAVNKADDQMIQFSTGGRTLNFTIPAGQTSAFPTNPPSIQVGNVAGYITVTVDPIMMGGYDVTPIHWPPAASATIPLVPPEINTVKVMKVTGGFNILVTGYSTPRQVTQADFTFTPASGANLQTTQVTVPVDSAFTTWYTGSSSAQFGSSFVYTQPFTVQGSVSDIASVSVTLTNATGTSTAVSASF